LREICGTRLATCPEGSPAPAEHPGQRLFGGTDFAWYLFASAEGRAVTRDIFLDGNTFAMACASTRGRS
jgi:lipid A 3-O-deacylase